MSVARTSCGSRISEKGSSHGVNVTSDRYKGFEAFYAPDTAKGELKRPASWWKNPLSAKDVRERNCEETASALFSCPEEGCSKSSTLTTTLSAISTSAIASASTNFTGRCSTITSDGSGRRNAPLWKQKYQKPTRPPVLLPPTAPTACLVAGPSRQGNVVDLRNRWRTSFSSYFLLVKRLGARWPRLML